jgi:hypothetical protein
MLVLGLVGFTLLQLWYLHKALKLDNPGRHGGCGGRGRCSGHVDEVDVVDVQMQCMWWMHRCNRCGAHADAVDLGDAVDTVERAWGYGKGVEVVL